MNIVRFLRALLPGIAAIHGTCCISSLGLVFAARTVLIQGQLSPWEQPRHWPGPSPA